MIAEKKKPFNNEGGQMKGGRRKEVSPDHLPATRTSSFKLFSPQILGPFKMQHYWLARHPFQQT